ncbi:DDE family transposase [Pseudomonas duriflava]|uniref:DDE family transposase n=1 Tax=Pseudomonas duriflava TaxID=459528 RepID=A0A562PL61_9PSED|nr:DDE family transposase [Pseudomonas duriflava]
MKNTDTAKHKGYDAGKKVSGIKRHIVVDTQGLPHAVAVTTAEVTDRKGALQALERCPSGLAQVQSLLCDSSYTGEPFAQGVRNILGDPVTVQIAVANSIPLRSCLNGGWSNAALPGWRRTGGCGKTASESSTPAFSLSTWHSWFCYLKDREQALTTAVRASCLPLYSHRCQIIIRDSVSFITVLHFPM